ncbi:cysteine sulfinic acid decarboxylase [Musca vetustissima]|uniref:cysteine sulfinic acid decarboxylase n=1 Tax=Musca vetustissima TaxID=27455 RepID=UPI002AB6ABF6|nr:cysteine sulfinic acid decarboxylase [Musca vetustissima]
MIASESINGLHHSHHHHRQHQGSHGYDKSIFKKVDQVASAEYEEQNLAHVDVLSNENVNVMANSTNYSTNLTEAYANKSFLSKVNELSCKMEEMKKHLIPSHPSEEVRGFMQICVDEIIKSAVYGGTTRSNRVVEWHSPEDLKRLFDFKLNQDAESHDNLFSIIKKTIEYSVKTGHPYFINQLYSGVDPYALIGQWLTDALNPSVYTYEVSPVFTLMEEEVLSEMRRIVGFANNGYGDGIFCPGGSISNGYAISCARYNKFPNTKINGLFGTKRQIIFTSEDSHYSVEKLAMFMGFGSENVCKIKTDTCGKIDTDDLEARIQQYIREGCEPLMVSATAGTTVLGAYDNLEKIAKLCEKYAIWMHVDAAWGGGALMSQKYRRLLKGIERADSVTWNPHKMLTASQQCSTFLTKHKDILSKCHSTNATYLFQKDKFYDTSYDTGDKHIQCGRRADVFKFWFMWKAKGTYGLEQHINQIFRMAEYITNSIKKRDGFELVLENPECTNICFWYVPPSLRNRDKDSTYYEQLHKVAPKIKESMIKKGSMMVTYQPLRNLPNFFRIVLQNSCLNEDDMDYFLDEIHALGKLL